MTPNGTGVKSSFQSARFLLPGSPLRWLNLVTGGPADKPPLLCLHGGTGNWSNFRPLLAHLQSDFRCFLPELRGHGLSPWSGPCNLDELYADVEEVAATLPHPFTLAAHSFGGYFAVRLAAEHPDWVSALMLMNTASHIPAGLAMRVVGLASPLSEFLSSPEGLLSTGGDTTRYLIEQLVPEWDCTPFYARIVCPALVVLGGLDPLVPVALGRESARQISADTRVLPVGFHIAMWEQPRRLAEWLRELTQRSRIGPGASQVADNHH